MSKYALNISDDGRILSVTYEQYAPTDAVLVDALPTGETEAERDVSNWLYVNGTYVYSAVSEPASAIEQLATEARAKRDKLLAETDWTQVADAPIDTATRTAMRVYRQQLRDITEQEGFPTDIVWPEMPTIVKATPEPIDEVVEAIIGVEVTE